MRDDRARLQDVLEAIERIRKYTDQGQELFRQNELMQVWVLHHLQIIGEAVAKLSPAVFDSNRALFRQIVGMRNILVLISTLFGRQLKKICQNLKLLAVL